MCQVNSPGPKITVTLFDAPFLFNSKACRGIAALALGGGVEKVVRKSHWVLGPCPKSHPVVSAGPRSGSRRQVSVGTALSSTTSRADCCLAHSRV